MTRLSLLLCTISLLVIAGCRGPSPARQSAGQSEIATTGATHQHHSVEGSMTHRDHSAHVVAAQAPLSGDSIYHVAANFEDQHGKPFELASLRGSAVLATMFYASCTSICPMLITQLANIDRALAPETRARTRVLAITLDPERDSADALQHLAEQHGVDDPRWHFVRTQKDDVRELAALLGIRYSKLPDGEISHSPVIALLDRDGALVTRSENGGGDPAALAAAIDRMMREAKSPAAHALR